jgi:hypothetical protein
VQLVTLGLGPEDRAHDAALEDKTRKLVVVGVRGRGYVKYWEAYGTLPSKRLGSAGPCLHVHSLIRQQALVYQCLSVKWK